LKKEIKWRVLPFEYNHGFMNMAIDEALSESVKKSGQPIIRFYGWLPSTVSIGFFQSLRDEVNVERCNALGITIVRRRTGGGAVYHSNSDEITYSVIGPVELFPKNIIDSYKLICGWVMDGIETLGVDCEFKPINDIVLTKDSKKISGNAQTRRDGILLQHGTILYNVNAERMFSVLKVPDEKIKDKLIKSVKDRVTCIKNISNVSRDMAYKKIQEGFLLDKMFTIETMSSEELTRAKELVKTKYSTDSWNYMK